MPDWFELPDWFGPVVATAAITAVITAVITEVVRRALGAFPRGWFRSGLRRVNHWRKFVIGTKRTRAGVISLWKKAPPWMLSSTLFRWFEADPQAGWRYVNRVYRSHGSVAVRESARDLLWVEKPAAEMQVGDIDYRGKHVLGLYRQGDAVRIDTGDGSSTTYRSGTTMARVNRGWCPRGEDCPNC